MSEELPAVVFDIGSTFSKVGFAGDDYPRGCPELIPSLVGLLKACHHICVGSQVNEAAGEYAFIRRHQLRTIQPVRHGVIQDWNCLEKLVNYSFWTWLRSHPMDYAMLWCENGLNSKEDREKIVQLMFETFKVPGFHMVNSGVLALMATGRTSGIVLEVGDGSSQAIPVLEGHALKHAIVKLDFAGDDMTKYLLDGE